MNLVNSRVLKSLLSVEETKLGLVEEDFHHQLTEYYPAPAYRESDLLFY